MRKIVSALMGFILACLFIGGNALANTYGGGLPQAVPYTYNGTTYDRYIVISRGDFDTCSNTHTLYFVSSEMTAAGWPNSDNYYSLVRTYPGSVPGFNTQPNGSHQLSFDMYNNNGVCTWNTTPEFETTYTQGAPSLRPDEANAILNHNFDLYTKDSAWGTLPYTFTSPYADWGTWTADELLSPEKPRYPIGYSLSNPNGWSANKQSYGSLNNTNGVPHVAEDWNKGSGSDDLGEALYAILDGTIKKIDLGNGSDGWGKTILIQHDAPAGKYFLTGTGELLTTVYAMYAHMLKSGQTGYNSALDLVGVVGDPVLKGAPVGQVGTGDGQYGSHLHFEIRKSDPNSYRTDSPYAWSGINTRVDPSELINNGWYSSQSTIFSLIVHPYECTGTFKLNSTTPNCDGSSSSVGNWNRQGANFNPGSPQLGYSGIIFSKGTNAAGTASWSPTLPKDGRYKVWVYVPADTTYTSSTSATYTVSSNGTTYTSQTVNQYTAAQGSNRWVDIGTYDLYAAGSSMVSLEGNTGEASKSITVDAVKFEYLGAIP